MAIVIRAIDSKNYKQKESQNGRKSSKSLKNRPQTLEKNRHIYGYSKKIATFAIHFGLYGNRNRVEIRMSINQLKDKNV